MGNILPYKDQRDCLSGLLKVVQILCKAKQEEKKDIQSLDCLQFMQQKKHQSQRIYQGAGCCEVQVFCDNLR